MTTAQGLLVAGAVRGLGEDKSELKARMIFFGESSVRRAMAEVEIF